MGKHHFLIGLLWLGCHFSQAQEFQWKHDTTSWTFYGLTVFDLEPDGNVLIAQTDHGLNIKRLDSEGNTIAYYSTPLSSPTVRVRDMIVSEDHKIYVVGSFSDSIDIGLNGTPAMLYSNAYREGFIAVYDSAMTPLWYSSLNSNQGAYTSITQIDVKGENFVINGFYDFGTIDLDFGVGQNIQSLEGTFVASYDTSAVLNWTNGIYFTTLSYAGYHVGIDGAGNVYMAGNFEDDMTMYGSPQSMSLNNGNGTLESFIGKYSNTGSVEWLNQIGGSGTSVTGGLDLDDEGIPVIVVFYEDDINFNIQDTNHTYFPSTSTLVRNLAFARYDPGGNVIDAFSSEVATGGRVLCSDIVAKGEAIYISGDFRGSFDFAVGQGSSLKSAHSVEQDAFVARYDTNGMISWSVAIGHADSDMLNRVRTLDQSEVYTAGWVSNPLNVDFDPHPNNVVNGMATNSISRFLLKYKDCGSVQTYDSIEICQGDSASISGEYYHVDTNLTVLDPQWGECNHVEEVNLIVHPLPDGSLWYDELELCIGDSFSLGASVDSTTNSTYYLEYNGSISESVVDTTFDGSNSQITLNITDTIGCVNHDTCRLRLAQTDTSLLFSQWLNDSTLQLTLQTNALNPGELTWDFGEGTSLIDTGLVQTHTYLEIGTYQICVTGLDCDSISACIEDSLIFPLGMHENSQRIIVFPNPANRTVAIEGLTNSILSVEWLTIDGRLMKSLTEVDARYIPTPSTSGMFIMNITDVTGRITRLSVLVDRR